MGSNTTVISEHIDSKSLLSKVINLPHNEKSNSSLGTDPGLSSVFTLSTEPSIGPVIDVTEMISDQVFITSQQQAVMQMVTKCVL